MERGIYVGKCTEYAHIDMEHCRGQMQNQVTKKESSSQGVTSRVQVPNFRTTHRGDLFEQTHRFGHDDRPAAMASPSPFSQRVDRHFSDDRFASRLRALPGLSKRREGSLDNAVIEALVMASV